MALYAINNSKGYIIFIEIISTGHSMNKVYVRLAGSWTVCIGCQTGVVLIALFTALYHLTSHAKCTGFTCAWSSLCLYNMEMLAEERQSVKS